MSERGQATVRGERPAAEQAPARPSGNGAAAQLLDQVLEQTAARIDATATRYSEALEAPGVPALRRALLMAEGIKRLRQAITPEVMSLVMELMNTANGFLCDRPNKANNTPYSVNEVKEAFITALLLGFYPVGNEWNIIAGKFYGAQNGYRRKLAEVAGVSDVEEVPGVPTVQNGQTVVRVLVRWKQHGRQYELLDHRGEPGRVYAVVAHQNSGPDQAVGKALRKALRAAYLQATGSRHAPDEEEAPEPPPAEDENQTPESDPHEGIRSEVEAHIASRGLAGAADLAMKSLAKSGVPEARALASLGLKVRKDVTVDHLVTLKEGLQRITEGGEAPITVFPPAAPADPETQAEREAIAREGQAS